MWKKYVSLGRIGGQAVVERASEEECEAINSLFGWNNKPGDSVRIPLELFDQELRESGFGNDLLELHRMLKGKPLLTKSERKAGHQENWRRLFAEARGAASDQWGPYSLQ
ncbi:TIGR02679 domain-containing protein [Cohnella massiliensis]|nr:MULTISPECIES: TIGR02679 domain-containing protein [Cohnella]